MRILWSDEALGDLEEILAYYYLEASPRVAEAVEKRIVGEIEALPPTPNGSGKATGFLAPANWSCKSSRTWCSSSSATTPSSSST